MNPSVPPVDLPADVAALLARADADCAAANDCVRAACERGVRRGAALMRAATALRERAQVWRALASHYERALELGIEARACLAAEEARDAAQLDALIRRELRR